MTIAIWTIVIVVAAGAIIGAGIVFDERRKR
jgi:hypothetical protein